jgi:hypothetical protein
VHNCHNHLAKESDRRYQSTKGRVKLRESEMKVKGRGRNEKKKEGKTKKKRASMRY